ncbi:MAG: GatB/YqeY domain-containing protein [Burkholderiaceae bacterium]
MSLKDSITDDMKAAMRAKDAPRLSAIRLLIAAIKQKEIDERIELDDAQILSVIDKVVKQRRDSITQYQAAGRDDLVAIEQAELDIYSAYLPAQASDAEIAAAVSDAVQASGASGMADMGKVMGLVKQQLAGKADMGKVSAQVKAALSKA